MARIYARKRGKSGSKKPSVSAQWVEYKKDEIERLIVKLAKDGLSSAKIGLVLRDQYGIPSVKSAAGDTIYNIMKKNKLNISIPEDLFNLLKKSVKLNDHMKKYKKDNTSKRGLELLESKIRRLVKYYVKTKRLPKDWKYNAETAKLIIETAK